VTDQARSRRNVASTLFAIATAAFAIGIFMADTVTRLEIAAAALYVVVILMVSRFLRAQHIALVAAGCVALTILSYFLTDHGPTSAGIINSILSIVTIALTTFLVLQRQAAEVTLRDRANLLDLTHDAIFVRDTNDLITYWNRGAEELYGWSREEANGQVSHRLMKTIFPAPLEKINEQLLATGRWEGELVHTKRDGSQVVVASRWSLQQDEHGNPRATLETNNDITQHRRAEERLHAAMSERSRLAAFREEIGMALAREENLKGILHKCAEAIVRHLDAAFARIWTLSSDGQQLELQASAGMYTHLDGSHGRIPFGHLKIGLIAQERKPHFTNDVQNDPRVNDKDWARRERMISFAGYPLLVDDRVVGVLGMFSQKALTESTLEALSFIASGIAQGIDRKRGEEALRRQANLLEQTHDAIFVWEFPGTIIYWNHGAKQLYGFSKEEAIGRLSHDLLGTEHGMPTDLFEAIIERDGMWAGELTHTTRDSRRIIVESRHVLMRERDGRRLVLETNRDITERKRAEESLHKTQAELAHVARIATLGEMTASIAHEINQPLGAIVNNASASLRWLTAENFAEARRSVELAIEDGHRAGEIIQRIRSFAKKAPPQKDWIDINQTIREVIALAQGEAQRTHMVFETRLSDDVHYVPMIFADRIQLQQVILNLIINAVEAMSENIDGRRQVLLRTGTDASGAIVVAVQDSGPGLSPENIERVFTPFYTTKPHGMGMGLAICRSIVEAHGGRLWATVNSERGATFQFTLPSGGSLG
jgi:two-component system sensor kinase FixL